MPDDSFRVRMKFQTLYDAVKKAVAEAHTTRDHALQLITEYRNGERANPGIGRMAIQDLNSFIERSEDFLEFIGESLDEEFVVMYDDWVRLTKPPVVTKHSSTYLG